MCVPCVETEDDDSVIAVERLVVMNYAVDVCVVECMFVFVV